MGCCIHSHIEVNGQYGKIGFVGVLHARICIGVSRGHENSVIAPCTWVKSNPVDDTDLFEWLCISIRKTKYFMASTTFQPNCSRAVPLLKEKR